MPTTTKNLTKLKVLINPLKTLIQPTTGWSKKGLADQKLDLLGLCEFGCTYCSSDSNLWHQFNKRTHAEAVQAQTGFAATPFTHPFLSYHFPDVEAQLTAELTTKRKTWGAGKTLAFGCLTDNFSPSLVKSGMTMRSLEAVVQTSSFRIRITTKNAVVGNDDWIEFFRRYPGRIVVNLSIGTLDDDFARLVEIGTPKPSARIRAMRKLQDAGIPTGGMLCPIFPAALPNVDALLAAIRPDRCEHVWAEPYNDRQNWDNVTGHKQTEEDLARMYDSKSGDAWSEYAVNLYKRLRLRAETDGWADKLVYMLYESSMSAHYARTFTDLRGVLLQSVDKTGRSKHPVFAELQERLKLTRHDRIGYDEPERTEWTDPGEPGDAGVKS